MVSSLSCRSGSGWHRQSSALAEPLLWQCQSHWDAEGWRLDGTVLLLLGAGLLSEVLLGLGVEWFWESGTERPNEKSLKNDVLSIFVVGAGCSMETGCKEMIRRLCDDVG